VKGEPDIEFEATVRSRKLRFGSPPEAEVSVHGSPGHESAIETERRNLPEEVAAGHTYRNAWVRLRVAGRLPDR
jgi:hypothetical protein